MKIKIKILNQNLNSNNENNLDREVDFNSIFIPIGKSGIHIKKENRGKFTDYCGGKVTDACIQLAKNSSNPTLRKRATFAENARGWARKHQEGGNLQENSIIDENYLNNELEKNYINKLFVDVDPISSEIVRTYDDLNDDFKIEFVDRSDNAYSELFDDEENENESITPEFTNSDYLNNYDGGTGGSSVLTTTDDSKYNKNVPEFLRNAISPLLGLDFKLGGKPQNGQIDCSGFVSYVLKNLGVNIFGNCRTLWNKTSRVDKKDIKVGDLVFLQNTQPSRFGPGIASHVAIVTDISNLSKGIIGVAQANHSGTKSSYGVWNINKNNYLGAGRYSIPQKFLFGGNINSLLVDPYNSDKEKLDNQIEQLKKEYEISNDEFLLLLSSNNNYSFNHNTNNNDIDLKETEPILQIEIPYVRQSQTYNQYKGYLNFKQQFNEYVKTDPSAKKYEAILTSIAKHESGFNSSIKNKNYPAYGYFQFIEDGRVNNISNLTGLSVEQFRNNPQALIKAAVKMIRNIESQLSSKDIALAESKGYNMNALIQGAWLGGVGGVRNYLYNGKDASDGASRVSEAMARGNKVK